MGERRMWTMLWPAIKATVMLLSLGGGVFLTARSVEGLVSGESDRRKASEALAFGQGLFVFAVALASL
jgi:hypothetical protein